MALKNSFHTELAIGILISDEVELERKLDMLTEISLCVSSKETLAICERFRERLCGEQEKTRRPDSLPRIYKSEINRDTGNEVSNEIHGVK
jgi:hypothetical protein